ncbi:MAG TPA: M23 family metallopeptidase [Vicinamibacterales bacterium]
MAARTIQHLALGCALALVAGCGSNGLMSRFTLAKSPHQRYAEALRAAPLGETAMARDWLRAGEDALRQPLTIALPLRESGYFAADQPTAVAYQFELARGRRFAVEITFDTVERAQLFIDLFEVRDAGAPERVASLTEGNTLLYDARRDGRYLLRVQPELLRSGRYTLVQRTLASLPFPVSGLTATAVQSEFGAERDAGRRQHEGIDIFAARNTPVFAVVDGIARSDTNGLGGNVVWLRDRRQARSFYYAHLTRAAFEGTATVNAGDLVGYIGNTGNARTTAPHLHFGIYQQGAVDPLPFLRADDPVPAAPAGADQFLAQWVRVSTLRATLRSGVARDAGAVAQLNRFTLARVTGVTDSRFRVELPDRSNGYLDRSSVIAATAPVRRQTVRAGEVIRDRPLANAPAVATISQPDAVEVIGEFNGFSFIRPATGSPGWLALEP